MERLTHEADFGLEDWEETLFFVKSDPNGAYNICDIARHEGEPEFDAILIKIALRLAAIENILGDNYDLDRLRDLVQADRDGRCVVLLCKEGDKLRRDGIEFTADHWNLILTAFAEDKSTKSGKRVGLFGDKEAEAALKASDVT